MDFEIPATLNPPGRSKPSAVEAREVAVRHAQLLQHRKVIQEEILDNLILLSEYPLIRSAAYSAETPASSDAASFKRLVRLFQPSDYSDLLIERNVNGLCGYTLCPEPHRDTGPGGEWTLRGGQIRKRKDVEMWCSDKCARRAMFVQVQLNETAAYERAGIADIQIELYDDVDDRETAVDQATRALGHVNLEDHRNSFRAAEALAIERGESIAMPGSDRVKVILEERETQAAAVPPATNDSQFGHLLVEGHLSQLPFRPKPDSQA
ncbi:DUF408 domain protein [Drechmeria coniospora]|uniref:RNA polymerase II subunit B1 CTD phosphatase RPAP2 homolog n=1 Tax=Drechmeria coniospora TaxID=98403 RepID=A0A151GWJ8_DRECN|nr:DUF408 domain protein [Drechmeria coniospora]KYK61402.1 DUF408 domain protein [Drechmeria coniospora]ODA81163.1 hypothetical protein RJ55_04127 [Drechmeria coniospora]